MPLPSLVATTPPVGWLIVVLAVYAVMLVPVVFWALGRAGHRGLGWVLLPFFAAVTTAGLWLYVHQQVGS